MVRKLTKDDVTFTIKCEPEEISIWGNVLASGDDELDKKAEQWVIDQLDNGNIWAWCYITVTAEWRGVKGEASTGACSYSSEYDFKDGYYYEGMKQEALEELRRKWDLIVNGLNSL